MKARRTTSNRRRGSSPRHHLLEVNVRTASQKRIRNGRAGLLFLRAASAVVVLCLAGVTAWLVAQKFFLRNPEYTLRHLELHLYGVMTKEELVALTGLGEGRNIFSIDIEQAGQRLSSIPEVRSATVERVLPDTIEVGIEGRRPVFLLASPGEGVSGESFLPGKTFLCDRDGVMMRPSQLRDSYMHLPVLSGVDLSEAQPGRKLDSPSLSAALRLQQALAELPEETFRIRSVDVSRSYAAVVTDSSGARFTFGTMGDQDLPSQLERLRKLLDHCQSAGRRIETANLAVTRNTPVTFVLTPEQRDEKITPVTHPGKTPRREHP